MKGIIYVLDDNPMMQTFLKNYFSKEYKVECFDRVHKILKYMNAGFIPDLIIADVNIPEETGIQFLEKINNSGIFSEIPVIMLSGIKKSEMRVYCLEIGAVDYVTKPFNPKELNLKVSKHIDRAKTNSANYIN